MLYAVGTIGIGENANEVKTNLFKIYIRFIEIFLGIFFKRFGFLPGDGMLDIGEIFVTPIFHFNNNEGCSIEGNNIEFTVALSPVFIKNLESVFFQEFLSKFFA